MMMMMSTKDMMVTMMQMDGGSDDGGDGDCNHGCGDHEDNQCDFYCTVRKQWYAILSRSRSPIENLFSPFDPAKMLGYKLEASLCRVNQHETIQVGLVLQHIAVFRHVFRYDIVGTRRLPVFWSDRNPPGDFQSPPTFKPECKGGVRKLVTNTCGDQSLQTAHTPAKMLGVLAQK